MTNILDKDHDYFRAIYDRVYPMKENTSEFGRRSTDQVRNALIRMSKEFCDEIYRDARKDLLEENAALWRRVEELERKEGRDV